MNKEYKVFIKEIIFYVSILPLILNWILGVSYLDNIEKRPFIYRSFFVSLIFLVKSSFLYVMYFFISSIVKISFFNYLFFLLQSLLVMSYIVVAILQVLAYVKKQHYKILEKLDFYFNKFIFIIG